jgi:hypothetical protein
MDLNGHVIYAVDFDGTISFGRFPGVGEPNVSLIGFLKREKERGARLILNTCRTKDDLAVAVEYCKEQGLEFEYINENLPELIELYGGDTRKINADFYIDDKAVNPIAGHFTVVPAGFNFITKGESNHVEQEKEQVAGLAGGIPGSGADPDGGNAARSGSSDGLRGRDY